MTLALALALALPLVLPLSGTPVAAQDRQAPDEVAREGLEKLMRAMELFLGTIPLYEAPEVLPNGDIIIRRVPPRDGGREEERRDLPRDTRPPLEERA